MIRIFVKKHPPQVEDHNLGLGEVDIQIDVIEELHSDVDGPMNTNYCKYNCLFFVNIDNSYNYLNTTIFLSLITFNPFTKKFATCLFIDTAVGLEHREC